MIGNSSYGFEYVIAPRGFSTFDFIRNEKDVSESRKSTFRTFINSRKQYLNRLTSIGDNWISGGSKPISTKSVDLSCKILDNIKYWYEFKGHENFPNPRIIMGPTLSGGVMLEISLYNKAFTYINVKGDDLNCEFEKDGHFSEVNIDKTRLSDILPLIYNNPNEGR